MYFTVRWEKGGCKCREQSVHLDICSLKEESYRWTDQCWREHWRCFRSIRNALYFQTTASLYLENKLGLSINVIFQTVICSLFPPESSKSSVITYLAVGAGLDFTKYCKRSRTFGIQSTGAIRKLNTSDPSPNQRRRKNYECKIKIRYVENCCYILSVCIQNLNTNGK